MTNTFTKGILAGAVATPIHAALSWLWYFLGLTETTVTQIIARAALAIPPDSEIAIMQEIFGLAGHFLIGLLLAVILSFIMNNIGYGYYYFKGLGWGLLIWVLDAFIIPALAQVTEIITVNLVVLYLLDHLLWGLLMASMLNAVKLTLPPER